MTGRLYDAATLERWNVVNRVVADEELEEKGMAFARELAAGPTRAHAMTKRIVRAYLDGGIERADEVTPGRLRRALRHRGPPERRGVVPARRPRQGDVRGQVTRARDAVAFAPMGHRGQDRDEVSVTDALPTPCSRCRQRPRPRAHARAQGHPAADHIRHRSTSRRPLRAERSELSPSRPAIVGAACTPTVSKLTATAGRSRSHRSRACA